MARRVFHAALQLNGPAASVLANLQTASPNWDARPGASSGGVVTVTQSGGEPESRSCQLRVGEHGQF